MTCRYGSYDQATIELKKRQIEAQMDEYAQEIEDYRRFMEDWRAKQGWPPKEAAE